MIHNIILKDITPQDINPNDITWTTLPRTTEVWMQQKSECNIGPNDIIPNDKTPNMT